MTASTPDPVEIIATCVRRLKGEWLPAGYVDFTHGAVQCTDREEAERIIEALRAAGVMLVPTTVTPTVAKPKPEDLRVGMVCEMRRGGIRKITGITKTVKVGDEWKKIDGTGHYPVDVHWVRFDEGRFYGKGGRQWGPYFAKDIARVIET